MRTVRVADELALRLVARNLLLALLLAERVRGIHRVHPALGLHGGRSCLCMESRGGRVAGSGVARGAVRQARAAERYAALRQSPPAYRTLQLPVALPLTV